MDIDTDLETKAGIPHDAVVTHGELMRAFEAFKETNDERLARQARRRRRCSRRSSRASTARSTRKQRRLDEIDAEVGAAGARRRARAAAQRFARSSTRRRSTPMCAAAKARGLRALEVKAHVGRLQPGRRLSGAGRDRARDRRAAHRDFADPRHRRRAHDQRQRLQEAVHDGRARRSAGSARPTRARRPTRRRSTSCRSRRWSSTPCRRRPRRCSRTPPSTSTSGSPARSSRCSPRRKARPSSPATAPTSRRASSPTPRSPTPRGAGASIGYIATGAAGAFPASNPSDVLVDLDLCAEGRLPAERRVRDEPQDAGRDPQVQGHERQLSLAAAGDRGRHAPR